MVDNSKEEVVILAGHECEGGTNTGSSNSFAFSNLRFIVQSAEKVEFINKNFRGGGPPSGSILFLFLLILLFSLLLLLEYKGFFEEWPISILPIFSVDRGLLIKLWIFPPFLPFHLVHSSSGSFWFQEIGFDRVFSKL